jgi:hypothetical protein
MVQRRICTQWPNFADKARWHAIAAFAKAECQEFLATFEHRRCMLRCEHPRSLI